ncbi:uncharacterized protein LOC122075300 [Macadamia integrifolia]|uniref:uncharacterized protein LOC122075300 n=1 Tax=Macadamia integrifolia TaxID=60698 RepID=UPI001C4EBCE6|nr:uncharacterized protein LOC122075300 [Macadamia integrifolia]XP_042496207.1 uncharacterized protein LOC122075300 [Macadamia integrifolia]
MRETEKKKALPNKNHVKRAGRGDKGEHKLPQETNRKKFNAKEVESKILDSKPRSTILVSDSNSSTESTEVYENMAIRYGDDVYRSEVAAVDSEAPDMATKVTKDDLEEHLSDMEKKPKEVNEESDCETVKDSVSSQGDGQTLEDDTVERAPKVPKNIVKKESFEIYPYASRTRTDWHESNKQKINASHTPKKSTKREPSKVTSKTVDDDKPKNTKVHPRPSSESSEGVDDKPIEELKDIDILDEAANGGPSIGSEDESLDAEGDGLDEEKEVLNRRIEEMERRIEKLEDELREIAALEISLYSIVPEHGSSAHKVHTPARRLSRIYIHACKHWTRIKQASVARNTVSGLVLIAKSCGNDVPRLSFWLSNTIVLREIISQAFGNRSAGKPLSLKWMGSSGSKQVKKLDFIQLLDDWQETSTFTAALEKVECWIFSRIVESVWWQALTPHMQSPVEDLLAKKSFRRVLGPALGDQHQGRFSINLWRSAFQDASQKLCPVRSGRHECGCLPVLARMIMEQCVARLDVAMFNAILRESAHEIPTDPVSDPIVDPKVLPIPAGDLSFGSGAQLKNSVGNWSRWLEDIFGMDTAESLKEDQVNGEDEDKQDGDAEPKSFRLLNELSDLLMLPKDMLMERSIRKEVCPSIGLPLIKRILCNFTPDEFCPDPVPGAVLEFLNAESVVEGRLSNGESVSSFPCTAAPVVYFPPSLFDIMEKIGDVGGKSQLERNVSMVQRKGYTSDEELDELDSPLTSYIDKMPPSPTIGNGNGNGNHKQDTSYRGGQVRYELLREVWSV